jgi:hypothetical protein
MESSLARPIPGCSQGLIALLFPVEKQATDTLRLISDATTGRLAAMLTSHEAIGSYPGEVVTHARSSSRLMQE